MALPEQKPAYAASAPTSTYSRSNYSMSLFSMLLLSTLLHIVTVALAFLLVVLLQFFGFKIPLFDALQPKPHDLQFELVDNPPATPRDKTTKVRSDRNTRAGGQVVKNQPKQEPQRAAGNPSPAQKPARASRPTPQHQASHQTPMPRPQPVPHQQAAPTPRATHSPAPPQPKIPKASEMPDTHPMLPPNPIAPTIKTPSPSAPKTVTGPIMKTTSSSTGSGASGNPGPQQIPGGPISRQMLASGSPGSMGGYPGGGAGGRGSFNQNGSPGGGGGPAGIDAMAEPDFGPYMAELQRRIRRNWNPPKEDRSKRVVAIFTISRDGRLLDIRMQVSSGSRVADDAAMAAVRASAPFRPLPANYRRSTIDVQFTFDYEVSGGGSMSYH